MILDPETGLTLKQVYDFLSDTLDYNADSIKALRDTINSDYEVSDEELDNIFSMLERGEKLSPNDVRTLARAVGMDYELLTSKELAPDFTDRFISAVANLWAIRNKYRGGNNASTNNPAN